MDKTTNSVQGQPGKSPLGLSVLLKLAGLGFVSGAIIGQLIDIAYPISGALHYFNTIWKIESIGIEVTWWVPILYGIAGIILVVSHPLLDRKFGQKPRGGTNPGWGFVLACFCVFLVHWFMGPYLYSLGVPNMVLFPLMVITALGVWWFFDGTKGGLFMCLLTAVLGPSLEITMINVLELYEYTTPDILGVPLWFLGPYICGSPANGNLGRKYLAILLK